MAQDKLKPAQRHIAWLIISFNILMTDNIQSQDIDSYAKCECKTSDFDPSATLTNNDLVAIGSVVSIEEQSQTIYYSHCNNTTKIAAKSIAEQRKKTTARLLNTTIDGVIIVGSCEAAEYQTTRLVTTISFDYEYLSTRPEGAKVIKQLFSSPCNSHFELGQSYLIIANYTDSYLRFANADGYRHAGNIRITDSSIDPNTSLSNLTRQDYLVTNQCMGTIKASESQAEIIALQAAGNSPQRSADAHKPL